MDRQAQATDYSMPYLVPLALRGVPANTWTWRTTEAVLWRLGIVVKIADNTVRRHDMAIFGVWLRLDDPAWIPPWRILVVEEPYGGRCGKRMDPRMHFGTTSRFSRRH